MSSFNSVTEGNATDKYFYMNLNVDVSNAMDISIEFTLPDGSQLIKDGGAVTVPDVDLLDPNDNTIVIAEANKYLAYKWIETDLPVGTAGIAKAYPRMTLAGRPQAGECSACFRILAKDACC